MKKHEVELLLKSKEEKFEQLKEEIESLKGKVEEIDNLENPFIVTKYSRYRKKPSVKKFKTKPEAESYVRNAMSKKSVNYYEVAYVLCEHTISNPKHGKPLNLFFSFDLDPTPNDPFGNSAYSVGILFSDLNQMSAQNLDLINLDKKGLESIKEAVAKFTQELESNYFKNIVYETFPFFDLNKNEDILKDFVDILWRNQTQFSNALIKQHNNGNFVVELEI